MNKYLATVLVSSFVLSGCAPLIIGGAATAGYLAVQERGAKQAVVDSKIKTHIFDRLTAQNYKFLAKVGVDVLQGDVLLTGMVSSQNEAAKVLQTVQNTEGVATVFNQLLIGQQYTAQTYANDTWIGSTLRARMIGSADIFPVNYMINIVNGNVYIIGIAQSMAEKERLLHLARTTKGVQQVYDYIRLRENA